MDTKKLRQKILDLAIRGKLVPQDPNDEPASVLLERIRAEKERLIKEGKIKRSKKSASDTPHYENIDFDVPSSWEIITLSEVFFMHAGKSISAADISPEPNEEYRYLCVGGNGKRGYVSSYNTVGAHPIIGRQGALCGNVNYTDGQVYATEHAVVVDTFCETEAWWAYYFLKQLNLNQYATATAQPGLSVNTIGDVQIPLPPYKEQVRIVAAIEQWYSLIDALETAKEDLQTSIEYTKSKILDLAIHGRLVLQDPNDEPAIELLKRINPKFTPCDNAHCPYDIPGNWYWCKLIDLCSFLSRGKSPTYSEERKYPVFAQKCNLYGGGISLDQARFLDPNTLSKWPEDYKLLDGDVLVNSTGTGTVGRTRLFHSDCLGSYPFVVPDSHVSVIRTVGNIDSDYIYSIVSSRYGQEYIEDNLAGSTNQKELYIGVLENMLIPLPPYDEQRRIASKLKESFAILEAIQDSIEA